MVCGVYDLPKARAVSEDSTSPVPTELFEVEVNAVPPVVSADSSSTMAAFITPASYPRFSFNSQNARCVSQRRIVPQACVRDPYEVLGVSRDADANTIKRAYRRAALRNHPDVSGDAGAKERFLQVQEAYRILSDRTRRARYDRFQRGTESFFGKNMDEDIFSREYARNWRKNNPMPEDLDDSFASVIGDLFSQFTGNRKDKGVGIIDDFLDFLERRVGDNGESSSTSTKSSEEWENGGMRDMGTYNSIDVLQSEQKDCELMIQQLNTRIRTLEAEITRLDNRASDWKRRAENMDRSREYSARDAANEMYTQVNEHAQTLRERIEQLQQDRRTFEKRMDALKKRQKQIEKELEEKEKEARAEVDAKAAVDEELDRMKKELGL